MSLRSHKVNIIYVIIVKHTTNKSKGGVGGISLVLRFTIEEYMSTMAYMA